MEWTSENQEFDNLLHAFLRHDSDKIRNILLANNYSETDLVWYDYIMLSLALEHDRKDVARYLLSNKNTRVNREPPDERNHTALYHAVVIDDVDIVRTLLEKGASICDKKEGEMTPLCLAMNKSQYEIVDVMLSRYDFEGIVPENPDEVKHFLIACERDHLDAIKMFLRKGISVNSCVELTSNENPGYTPLHFAVRNMSLETVKYLLTAGADSTITEKYRRTALELAYEKRYHLKDCRMMKDMDEIVDMLIALGLAHFNLEDDNRRPLSYFHIACTRNNAALPSLFLIQGVNIHRRVHNEVPELGGYSGLHFAVQQYCVETMLLLIRDGADVNARSAKGWTPLNIAVHKGQLDLVDILLDAGADLYCKTLDGMTALHMAFYADNIEVIERLLQRDPKNINPSNRAGLTHFHIACTSSNSSHVDAYIANCPEDIVDVRVGVQDPDYPGYTPLHFSVHFEEFDIFNRLLQSRVNVNAHDARGRTALHIACEFIRVEFARNLLREGADVNALDYHGTTVLCPMLRSAPGFVKSVFEMVRQHLQLDYLLDRNISPVLINTYGRILRKYRQGIEKIYPNQALFECDLEHDDRALAIHKELKQLRRTSIDPYTTVYDLLHKNAVEMVPHCRNEAFRDFVHSDDLMSQYPCCGELLKLQYARGTSRDHLLGDAKNALCSVLGFGLPETCLENILKYFCADETRALVAVASRVQELKRRPNRTNQVAGDSGDCEPMVKNLRMGRDQ